MKIKKKKRFEPFCRCLARRRLQQPLMKLLWLSTLLISHHPMIILDMGLGDLYRNRNPRWVNSVEIVVGMVGLILIGAGVIKVIVR